MHGRVKLQNEIPILPLHYFSWVVLGALLEVGLACVQVYSPSGSLPLLGKGHGIVQPAQERDWHLISSLHMAMQYARILIL